MKKELGGVNIKYRIRAKGLFCECDSEFDLGRTISALVEGRSRAHGRIKINPQEIFIAVETMPPEPAMPFWKSEETGEGVEED